MKGKGKGKGILIALIVLVFILGIGVYVGGYWAQRATKEILGMAQIYYVDLSVAGVIDYAFYDPVGLTVMVITDLLLLFVAARIFMQRKRFNGGKIDTNTCRITS